LEADAPAAAVPPTSLNDDEATPLSVVNCERFTFPPAVLAALPDATPANTIESMTSPPPAVNVNPVQSSLACVSTKLEADA
jgi:hypothetical protein